MYNITYYIVYYHGIIIVHQSIIELPEMATVAKRPLSGVHGNNTEQHAAMFTWSYGQVGVRDLVLTQLPTIVRISEEYRSDVQRRKFNFYQGTVTIKHNLSMLCLTF